MKIFAVTVEQGQYDSYSWGYDSLWITKAEAEERLASISGLWATAREILLGTPEVIWFHDAPKYEVEEWATGIPEHNTILPHVNSFGNHPDAKGDSLSSKAENFLLEFVQRYLAADTEEQKNAIKAEAMAISVDYQEELQRTSRERTARNLAERNSK